MTVYAVVTDAGPAWDESRPRRQQDRWKEHADFIDGLAEEGFLLLVGPLSPTRALQIDVASTEQAVRDRLHSMSVWVAVDPSGTVVGTVAWTPVTPTEAHLRGMAVRPAHQGQGTARKLLARVLTHVRAAGHRRVTLDTTIPLGRAKRFYEKNGFRSTGKVSDFFGMPLFEYARKLELPGREPGGARTRGRSRSPGPSPSPGRRVLNPSLSSEGTPRRRRRSGGAGRPGRTPFRSVRGRPRTSAA